MMPEATTATPPPPALETPSNKSNQPSSDAVEEITERLSKLENLYFPRALQSSALLPSQRKSLLLDLFNRDVPVFLERYGSQLTLEELKKFDMLRDDYEINWHLNHLQSLISPTSQDLKSRSAKVKNRRRAYMDKLVSDGQFFSEDAMRDREPYLHHEFLGQFQDMSGRRMARPGEQWSQTLLRRAEEGLLIERIRREQQRLGVPERDWVSNERPLQEEQEEEEEDEEEEEEEEEEEGDEKDGVCANGSSHQPQVMDAGDNSHASTDERSSEIINSLSAEEMQERMDQFTQIMQQKFLSGEDGEHFNYSNIDEDETLDDHWMREANHDAEDKYFADV